VEPAPRAELPRGRLAALGFIGMAGALSTDLYLPAFPDLRDDLGATAAAVQLTLTAYLIGSAIGQFAIGTVSDALGRRRTLLAAFSVFTIAGFAAAAAPSLEWIVALRLVQGLSGSAGAAIARAIVADLATGERAARGISILIASMGIGPVLGSPLGALLTAWGGWRAALLGLAFVSAAMLVVIAVAVPESLPPKRRHPARVGALVASLGRLARNGAFVGFALAFALGYAGLMVYIGSSSFVVQNVFGATPVVYSLTFAAGAVSFVLGAWLNARVVRLLGIAGALRAAQLTSLAAALTLLALAVTGGLSLASWVPLVCVFGAGCGGTMSDASALTLGHAAFAAGAGSAALGLFQFSLGAVASPFGGLWGDDTAVPVAAGMTGAVVLGLAAAAFGRTCERRAADRGGDQRASGQPV
jgi:DHA1 family bicyclomycin/chloramphenicol resistance-like MFS transporter